LGLLAASVVQPLEHCKLVTPSSVPALEEGLASYLLGELGNENSCLTINGIIWCYLAVFTVEDNEANHQLGTKRHYAYKPGRG